MIPNIENLRKAKLSEIKHLKNPESRVNRNTAFKDQTKWNEIHQKVKADQ